MIDALTHDAVARLTALVAFDTTSRNSNLALIEWVEALLAPLGARMTRHPNEDGTKTNLVASFGPEGPGGVVLSGHTDVVPVDGQAWTTDPWTLTAREGRLHGRGACDMKGFLACALALAPRMAQAPLVRPIHLALSYDEEIGCVGAPAMVTRMAADLPPIEAVIVGEPTNMQVVGGQKGLSTYSVEIEGREAHSSQIGQGVSAIMEAIPLLATLHAIAARAREAAPPDSPFDPPGATVTVGLLEGGTAVNILARRCAFSFDVRHEADASPERLIAPLAEKIVALDAAIKARAPEGFARLVRRSTTPALRPEPGGAADALARQLTGDNALRTVAYGTEGGLFQNAGLSTVICGPGDIAQAHQPDEFVTLDQIRACVGFLDRLVTRQCAP
jgi:acetylornithine deacetylase